MREDFHLQLAQFLAPQRVKQQSRKNGAIALALERIGLRCCQQLACLMIAECRRFAFAAFDFRPLDAFHRIMRDRIQMRSTRAKGSHLKVSGKGGKTRNLPLHPGTRGLIHEYLEAAGHGTDENGALFRPVRNNITGRLDGAITPDGIYKLVRECMRADLES